jgi:MYXO-CTERM domain-containing protein
MTHRPWLPALALLGLAAPAHALDCAYGPTESFPGTETMDVPLNPVLRVVSVDMPPDEIEIRLVRADGLEREVMVETTEHGQVTVHHIRPVFGLMADQEYRLLARPRGEDGVWVEVGLETGQRVDAQPPEAPELRGVTRIIEDSEWGPEDFLEVQVGPTDELVFHRVILETAEGEPVAPAVPVLTSTLEAAEPRVGRRLCDERLILPTDAEGLCIRVEAVDLAGFATTAEPVDALDPGECAPGAIPLVPPGGSDPEAPEDSGDVDDVGAAGCACTAAGGPAGGLLALALPLLVLVRRRR